MINLVIIDDEPAAIEMMTAICSNAHLPINVAGTASTLDKGGELVRKLKPQLVFLDIEFPEGTGFDLLEQLQGMDFQLIFTTAYEHYALQAIKHHALDYILKPIQPCEIIHAIEGAMDRMNKEQQPRWNYLVQQLREELNKEEKREKLALPIKDGYRYIKLEDLVYLKADGSYTRVYLYDGNSLFISKKLSWFEKQLEGKGFLRVQRSYLVHQDHIVELHRNDGGYLVTTTNQSIPISKSFRGVGLHYFN